jgi:phosphohistidine swiveling domain-containing protein
MWIRSLAMCDAACGGKANGLARLMGAGLKVPEGFAIVDEAFRVAAGLGEVALTDAGHAFAEAAARIETAELPRDLVEEVEAAARGLGPQLAVRSSASIEDGERGAAAGVFASKAGVTLAELWPAIRAVWTSALTPLVASYARGREVRIAVIVQRFVEGERAVMYTRPPGEPARDEVWIQRGGAIGKHPRFALAERIEHAIAAPHGADVELVLASTERSSTSHANQLVALDDAWIVQARPIVHPVVKPRVTPPPSILAILDDGRRWTWDIAHNPDPLSPAQASLVEAVERAGLAPWSLRVCGGYLYSATKPSTGHAANANEPALVAKRVHDIELRLATILAQPAASIADAIARYLAFYTVWANELSPLVAAVRSSEVVPRGHRPSAVEATLLAAARGEITEVIALERLGVLAPAWDVAVPTYAEQPQLVRDAIARARAIVNPPVATTTDGLADLAERDDLWFAKAQWLVRRAILERAKVLGIAAEDAFAFALDELATEISSIIAQRRAIAQRTAASRAAAWAMPIVVGGEPPATGPALHGVGGGPPVTGRVRRFATLASTISVGAGDIVVARAITPALAVLVVGCAAIVSETGGLLDHGAALARELGITYVVGCRDAWTLLSDGMLVSVDGDRGVVTS